MSVKVEPRGAGRWRVRVFVANDPSTGGPRQLSRTFHAANITQAKKAAPGIEAELRREAERTRAEIGTVTEAVRAWQRHKASTSAATTQQRNQTIANVIIADLGNIQLHRLTTRHVDAWYDRLRTENIATARNAVRHRSESTIHHYHRVLRSILRQARKWKMVSEVVTEDATAPKRSKRRPTIPTTTTMLALITSAPPELRFAAALAARTGIRRGELLGLCWDDVEGPTLHVRRALVETGAGLAIKHTKTDEEREMVLGEETLAAITAHRQYLEGRAAALGGKLVADGPMFPNLRLDKHGRKPMRPHALTQAWTKHAGATHIRFHDLRHWHASALIDQGIPVSSVSSRMGHANTSTTLDIYTHAVRETDAQSATVIDRLLRVELPAPQVPPGNPS